MAHLIYLAEYADTEVIKRSKLGLRFRHVSTLDRLNAAGVERREVDRTLAPGGGQAIRLRPAE